MVEEYARADAALQDTTIVRDTQTADPNEKNLTKAIEEPDKATVTVADSSAVLTETAGVVVSSTASIPSTNEPSGALTEYRATLLNLVDKPKPQFSEDVPSKRLFDAYARLFVPWSRTQKLGYEELCARYVALWSVLERPEAGRYIIQALLGLKLMLAGRLTTASNVLLEIEFQTSTPAALSYVMRGVGIFLRSFIIIVFVMLYGAVFLTLNHPQPWAELLDTPPGHVMIAAVFGMLGSVVSLLLRLGEFETTKGRSQMFLMLTGATLPVVGGVFGAFVAALLAAKIVNINIGNVSSPDGLNISLCLVLGFLSGFSERFSRGFIRMAEDRLGPGQDRDPKLKVLTEAVLATGKSSAASVA